MTRDRIVLIAVILATVAVFLINAFLLPDVLLPAAPYAVLILIAALYLAPRAVIAVTAATLALQGASAIIEEGALPTLPLFMVDLALTGVVATLLADRRTRVAEAQARAEDRERESSEESARLRALVESMPDEVLFVDEWGVIQIANVAAVRGLGLERAEDAPASLVELVARQAITGPDGRPWLADETPLARSLRGETVTGVEGIVRHGVGGERRYVQVNASPVRDREGHIIGAVSVARDTPNSKAGNSGCSFGKKSEGVVWTPMLLQARNPSLTGPLWPDSGRCSRLCIPLAA